MEHIPLYARRDCKECRGTGMAKRAVQMPIGDNLRTIQTYDYLCKCTRGDLKLVKAEVKR